MESNEFYRLMKEAQTGNLTSYENGNATYAVPSNGITSDNFYDLMNAARSGNLSRDENGNFSYKKPVSTGASSSDAVKNAIAAAKQAATKAGNEVYSFLQGTDEAAQNNWLNDLNRQNDEQQANIDRLNTRLDEIKEADSNTPFSEKIKTLITGEKSEAAKARDEEKVNLQKALEQALEENKLTKSKLDVAQQAYEKRTIRSSVEAAREGAASYADLIKDYSQSLDKLNKDRATAIEDLNRIRNGAGYYGAASTYEEDKARQEADEKDALARLEAAEKQIQRVTGMRNYAFARSANDKGADAIIRQGEELARTAKEQYLAGNMPDPTSNADYRTWVENNPGKTARDYAEQQYADREPNDMWTQEEKNRYFILMTDSPERAFQYAVEINSAINSETNAAAAERFAKLFPNYDMSEEARAGRSGITNALMRAGNAASDVAGIAGGVATGPVKLFNWLDNIYQNNERGGYYAGNNTPRISDYTDRLLGQNTERLNSYGTIREDVPILGGKGLGDLYQLVESVAQSMTYGAGLSKAFGVGATTAAGIQAAQKAAKLSTGLIFFGQAADSSYNEYVQRGMSREQAAVGSFFAGLAEAMGEELSIDHLISGDIADGLAKYVAKQSFIEASEEGFTNVLNLFGDELAARMTGGESKMRQDIEALKRSGMSEEDAKRQVWKQFVDDTVFDMLGGAISGGLSSGAYAAPNALYNYVQNRNNRNQQNTQTEQPAGSAAAGAQTRKPLYEAMRGAAGAATAQTAQTNQTPAAETATVAENATTEEPAPATPATAQAAETPTGETTTPTLEERRADLQRRLEDAMKRAETAPEEEWAALGEELDALDAESRQLQTEETQQARVQNGEVSKGYGTPENHIDRRTSESVGNVGMKSFQFDNPQLHGYYVEAAQALFDEVQNAEDADYGRKVNPNTRYERGSAITGPIRRLMDMGLTKPQIVKCLQDIIADNGQENYAAAKRVELVLNDMLTNGWQGQRGRNDWHEANADYIAAKDAIDGGIKADSWERFLAQNELSLIDGTVTEDELRAEWEQMHPQEEAATVAEPEPAATAEPQASAEPQPSAAPATGSATAPFTAPGGLNTKTQEREGRFSSNTVNRVEEAAGIPENGRHRSKYETKSEGQSVAEAASRLWTDRSGEIKKLIEAEAWGGAQSDMAARIASELYQSGDLDAYAEWVRIMDDHAKETGRGSQAWAKYTRKTGETAVEQVVRAVSENTDLNDEQRRILINAAKESADAYDAAMKDVAAAKNDGDKNAPDSLIDLIKQIARNRRTWTFFDGNLEKILKAQSGNVDYLSDLAYNQIISMSNDYAVKRSMAEYVKTFQALAQLSSVATFKRNLLGNLSFGVVDTLAKDAFGVAVDRAFSKFTGKREVAFDRGWASSTARKGAIDALQKSVLEVALDVDMDGKGNKYGEKNGRTFRMSGNAVERFFSRWEQLLSYSLTSSDKFFRGAIESENQSGLEALGVSEEDRAAIAEQEADYRLFQNKDTAYTISRGIHDVFNAVGFGGKGETAKERMKSRVRGEGGFGVGDIVNTYPGVPANLGVKPLEYSPANIAKGGIELFKAWKDAKNGKLKAGQQYQAVMDIARGLAGTPIIALFAAMFKAGLIKNWDNEDDKDIKAQNAAEGKSGIQFNLSGTLRWLSGGSAEWKNGDTLDSIGYLEPINAFMGIGSLVADLDEDATKTDMAKAYANGAIQSFLEIPVMGNLKNMIDTFSYSTADGVAERAGEALLSYAGNSLTGFVPAPVRGIAKATDPYYRDTKGDSIGESAKNSFMAAIPGLRQQLPVKLDNFGNPKEYGGTTASRLYDTLFRAGSRTTLRQSEESAFISSLSEATGETGILPDRKAPKKLDIDGEKVELSQDEQRLYQETTGHFYESLLRDVRDDELFSTLEPETQASICKELLSTAKQKAKDAVAAAHGAKASTDYSELITGVKRAGDDIPALDEKNVGEYIAYDTALKTAVENGDYASIDNLLARYSKLNQNTQDVLSMKNPAGMNNLLKYVNAGSSTESYFKLQEAIGGVKEMEDTSSENARIKFNALVNADIPEKEKAELVESGAFDVAKSVRTSVGAFSKAGYSIEDAYNFYMQADSTNGKSDGEVSQGELVTALEKDTGMSQPQKNAIYEYYMQQNGWKTGYDAALKNAAKSGKKYGTA